MLVERTDRKEGMDDRWCYSIALQAVGCTLMISGTFFIKRVSPLLSSPFVLSPPVL